jgi:hypothetical protein
MTKSFRVIDFGSTWASILEDRQRKRAEGGAAAGS